MGFLFGKKGKSGENFYKKGMNTGGMGQAMFQGKALMQPGIQKALQDYAKGKISLGRAQEEARVAYKKLQGSDPNAGTWDPSFFTSLAQSTPGASERMQKDYLKSDPQMSKLFGRKGLTDQLSGESRYLADEARNLRETGFGLQEDDRTAFGQAAGDITRQYGQQESNIANALAQRGLSGSGAAIASFAGLQGNKMEQLAKAQKNIADARYERNLQRLQENLSRINAARTQLQNLGGMSQDIAQQRINQGYQDMAAKQQMYMTPWMLKNDLWAKQQDQANKAFQQQQDTKSKGLLGSAVSAIGGAATGGFGAAIGGSLGKSLMNSKDDEYGNAVGSWMTKG